MVPRAQPSKGVDESHRRICDRSIRGLVWQGLIPHRPIDARFQSLLGLRSMIEGGTKKHLDIARIAAIKQAAQVFLTLHGGSGTDDEDFRKAVAAGINIVHINTELRVAWRRGLEQGLAAQPDEVVPYKILPVAVDSVKQVVVSRLNLFNSRQMAQNA